jgi:hypothetical protein
MGKNIGSIQRREDPGSQLCPYWVEIECDTTDTACIVMLKDNTYIRTDVLFVVCIIALTLRRWHPDGMTLRGQTIVRVPHA